MEIDYTERKKDKKSDEITLRKKTVREKQNNEIQTEGDDIEETVTITEEAVINTIKNKENEYGNEHIENEENERIIVNSANPEYKNNFAKNFKLGAEFTLILGGLDVRTANLRNLIPKQHRNKSFRLQVDHQEERTVFWGRYYKKATKSDPTKGFLMDWVYRENGKTVRAKIFSNNKFSEIKKDRLEIKKEDYLPLNDLAPDIVGRIEYVSRGVMESILRQDKLGKDNPNYPIRDVNGKLILYRINPKEVTTPSLAILESFFNDYYSKKNLKNPPKVKGYEIYPKKNYGVIHQAAINYKYSNPNKSVLYSLCETSNFQLMVTTKGRFIQGLPFSIGGAGVGSGERKAGIINNSGVGVEVVSREHKNKELESFNVAQEATTKDVGALFDTIFGKNRTFSSLDLATNIENGDLKEDNHYDMNGENEENLMKSINQEPDRKSRIAAISAIKEIFSITISQARSRNIPIDSVEFDNLYEQNLEKLSQEKKQNYLISFTKNWEERFWTQGITTQEILAREKERIKNKYRT